MQELRFVLIVVGLLAIAALLFHGLWISRKEGKSKFSDKPLGRMKEPESSDKPSRSFFAMKEESDVSKIKKERREPGFSVDSSDADPLIDGSFDEIEDSLVSSNVTEESYLEKTIDQVEHELDQDNMVIEPLSLENEKPSDQAESISDSADDFDVIVLSVHCAAHTPFVGTDLFESMQQNGLLYGEMDIFHRHADLSGTGKILFSVANIVQPGTLRHDDPAMFTTKGISFFMTLPCFGDPEQNFKLMLKTAQQIADDLGGNVVDERRNLITPNKLNSFRKQIQNFKVKSTKPI